MPSRDFDINRMFEQDAVGQAAATYGLAQTVTRLQQDFDDALEFRNQRGPLLGEGAETLAGGYDRELLSGVIRQHRQLHGRAQAADRAAPAAVADRPRTSLGSLFHTDTPPYLYEWTWSTTQDTPSVSVSSAKAAGTESFSLYSNLDQASSASCAAAVGTYFRPVVANGILKITSNPAVSWDSAALSVFNTAHSDGWVGLYVGQYTLAGGSDGTPIDQQITFWNLNSGWLDTLYAKGSSSGYPLSAQIQVDQSHYYLIWVWVGGSISADGYYTFNGSGSWSTMNVSVPSISWELF